MSQSGQIEDIDEWVARRGGEGGYHVDRSAEAKCSTAQFVPMDPTEPGYINSSGPRDVSGMTSNNVSILRPVYKRMRSNELLLIALSWRHGHAKCNPTTIALRIPADTNHTIT